MTGEPAPRQPLTPAQQAMVASNMHVVAKNVTRLGALYAGLVDRDDLYGLGRARLVAAALAYDPEREVPFAQFAEFGVLGGMLDGVRKESRQRAISVAAHRAAARHLATCDDELDVLKHDERDARRRMEGFSDHLQSTRVESAVAEATSPTEEEEDAVARDAWARAFAALRAAHVKLSDDDLRLLELLHRDELTHARIAAELGIDERTVRRRAERLHERLRAEVERAGVTDVPRPMVVPWPWAELSRERNG